MDAVCRRDHEDFCMTTVLEEGIFKIEREDVHEQSDHGHIIKKHGCQPSVT